MINLDAIKNALPDYAKDLRLNLGTVPTTPNLSAQQIWGSALACAMAARQPDLIRAIEAEAAAHLSPQAAAAARTAAAVMAMNNVYYRYLHLSPTADFRTMPARLRMNGIASHGIEALDFELFSLAVSAINGCGMCIEAHEHEVFKKGATKEQVQDAVRIAAVIHAVGTVLSAVEATAGGLAAAA